MKKIGVYGYYRVVDGIKYTKSIEIRMGTGEKKLGAAIVDYIDLEEFEITSEKKRVYKLSEVRIKPNKFINKFIHIIEAIYKNEEINGVFEIFPFWRFDFDNVDIKKIDKKIGTSEPKKILVGNHGYDFIILAWGEGDNILRREWLNNIIDKAIWLFGIPKEIYPNFYAPDDEIYSYNEEFEETIIKQYEDFKKIRESKSFKIFNTLVTRHNCIVFRNENMDSDRKYEEGWNIGKDHDVNYIVNGFSQIHVKKDYKLVLYQRIYHGQNGRGRVWAIAKDSKIPDIEECDRLEDSVQTPKPKNALSHILQGIEGDKSPLSYLQAAIAYQELLEVGAIWHGNRWNCDIALPLDAYEKSKRKTDIRLKLEYEWNMRAALPPMFYPYFYYNENDEPVVVYMTFNYIAPTTLNMYIHTFSKEDYMQKVERKVIGYDSYGIRF